MELAVVVVAVAVAVALALAVAVAPAAQDNAPKTDPNTATEAPRHKSLEQQTNNSKPFLWPQHTKLETTSFVPKQTIQKPCKTNGFISLLALYKFVLRTKELV